MADQFPPVLGAAKARRYLLHTPQRLEQRLVEYIGANAQDALHQPVGLVGQAQVTEAVVMAMAANSRALARMQLQLFAQDLHAAAHRALVHGQGQTCLGLGAGQLEKIQHMQIQQQVGR